MGEPTNSADRPRVTGIGGVFFKARDPEKLAAWYRDHLGISIEGWGGARFPLGADGAAGEPFTVWSPFPEDTDYFAPSTQPFMINFRVRDLHDLLDELEEKGVTVDDDREESELGTFGWVMDPEGNKIELWEPRRDAAKSSE
ncbi:MAG: VOC family protein [Euryarchaeota archaeon]|nr:VOC family protein [Euryarchaeota archaeon]